eukprot:6198750-Pleurochrysis_carterae.AAC.3
MLKPDVAKITGQRPRFTGENPLVLNPLRNDDWLWLALGRVPDINRLAGSCYNRFCASESIQRDKLTSNGMLSLFRMIRQAQ